MEKKANKNAKTSSSKKEEVKAPVLNADGLQEITLLKDHGVDKKGANLFKHPKTAKMLIERKIAK